MIRRCDIGLFAGVALVAAAALLAATGQVIAGAIAAALAMVAILYCRTESRRAPQAMPNALWWSLLLPRGRHAPRHLLKLLEPIPGERILEIGPGIGVHSIPVAQAVGPGGRVAAVDISPAMLAKLRVRAARKGTTGIEPHAGDACHLPFPDRSFDAAYLISVLGEVPDRPAAWGELRRVLKPGGRLVVGETALDPDFVGFGDIAREAEAHRFDFQRLLGSKLSFLALFHANAGKPGVPGNLIPAPSVRPGLLLQ